MIVRVWAPGATRVELVREGRRSLMERGPDGWWASSEAVPAGVDYAVALDDGPPRPDPRAARLPHGVHGPSQRVEHGRFRWLDAGFRPTPLREGVVYLFGSRNLLDFGFAITPEQAEGWLDALLALVRIAEGLPTPQVTDAESAAERMARSMRSRSPYVMLAIAVGIVGMVVLCSVAIGLAAYWWASAQ